MASSKLVEHFFRHEYSRLVAMLTCRIGVQHTEDVEDAVQAALMVALESWTTKGLPHDPSAWVYRVASNKLMGELRQRANRKRLVAEHLVHDVILREDDIDEREIEDDLLRMLFVCCDQSIPQPSQLVLALKTLCGFDVREIAIRLFTSEASVLKRLTRARSRLRERPYHPDDLVREDYAERLSGVHEILYLLFTEGYLSSHTEVAIRSELCEEAIRLTMILADHEVGKEPKTYALLALMFLHYSRITARLDGAGGLLLLEEQDREQWNQGQIQRGLEWLEKSAQGEVFSRYHAEAGIAAEHCMAQSFEKTRWDRIAENYELLERVAPSILHTLNRAVAVAEWKGAEEGLEILHKLDPPAWLGKSYMWSAVLADLHRRCGNNELAEHYRVSAIDLAPTPAVKKLLQKRLGFGV
ncbi:MAG: RNA polymerase sigma factor [Bacteroidota bacterium]